MKWVLILTLYYGAGSITGISEMELDRHPSFEACMVAGYAKIGSMTQEKKIPHDLTRAEIACAIRRS